MRFEYNNFCAQCDLIKKYVLNVRCKSGKTIFERIVTIIIIIRALAVNNNKHWTDDNKTKTLNTNKNNNHNNK